MSWYSVCIPVGMLSIESGIECMGEVQFLKSVLARVLYKTSMIKILCTCRGLPTLPFLESIVSADDRTIQQTGPVEAKPGWTCSMAIAFSHHLLPTATSFIFNIFLLTLCTSSAFHGHRSLLVVILTMKITYLIVDITYQSLSTAFQYNISTLIIFVVFLMFGMTLWC